MGFRVEGCRLKVGGVRCGPCTRVTGVGDVQFFNDDGSGLATGFTVRGVYQSGRRV